MMKGLPVLLLFTALIASTIPAESRTVDEYIHKAAGQQQSGYLTQAVETMEQAVGEYPGSLEAHSYLGLYLGMLAGGTKDMNRALDLVNRSFEMLDRAVQMDDRNLLARFHRGLIDVSVPEFFGRLDQGIADLEYVLEEYQKAPQSASRDRLMKSYDLLAGGYRMRGDTEKARWAYEQIIDLAPGSELAASAEAGIDELSGQRTADTGSRSAAESFSPETEALEKEAAAHPDDLSLQLRLGYAYRQDRAYEKARQAFEAVLAQDKTDAAAYKGLILTIRDEASQGYDDRIYDNTNLRTNLAFELVRTLDRAVAAFPEDLELRLWRGQADVTMPFFVKKIDQGIADLEMVASSEASDSLKAEALYWLGQGYQKKATTAWIQVVKEYDESPAAEEVFEQMSPGIKHADLSEVQKPLVSVDFVLGFRDELAPQTAVWVETADGRFVKTIYVSGFAGHVRERQVTLPVWGAVSEFVDVDAVTGASIDAGDHIFVWDLEDHNGRPVPPGSYVVKVEVSYWPSNLYQLAEAAIEIGKKQDRMVTEEGHFIPYLEVMYYPR